MSTAVRGRYTIYIRTFCRQNASDVTSCEKIFVIYALLKRIKFDDGQYEFGIDRLLYRNIFVDAFCLHEGPEKWTEDGPLNDRQVGTKCTIDSLTNLLRNGPLTQRHVK